MDWLDWNILFNSAIGTIVGLLFAGLIAYLIYEIEKEDTNRREDYNWRLEMTMKNIELIEEINSKLIVYEFEKSSNMHSYDKTFFNDTIKKEINALASKYQVFCRVLLNRTKDNTLEIFDQSYKYVNMVKSYIEIESIYKQKEKVNDIQSIISCGYYICDLYQDILD